MNSFVETLLDLGIDLQASGGPGYNTTIIQLPSGQEKRQINWSKARRKYKTGARTTDYTEFEYLHSFFLNVYGRGIAFRLRDQGDYKATGVASYWNTNYTQGLLSPAAGNGTITAFQLQKKYWTPFNSILRTIKKPVVGSVVPYTNGVAQTSGFTVDTTTGIVTFAAAPASGAQLAADFLFDTPVRFDTDELPQAVEAYDSFSDTRAWSVTSLPLIEDLI